MLPLIFALSGESLTPDERAFFRDAQPAGFILFGRNCANPAQLRALTDDLRALTGRDDLPILIDQEGGRIARLRPPAWPELPAAGIFDRLYQRAPISAIEAARLHGRAIASMLRDCGVTVNCAPILDLRYESSHPIIAERTLGAEPMQVAALGRAGLEGMRDGGVLGVIKHMPGHGRATADSHLELPVVIATDEELEADLRPFRSLNWAPAAMTAHVLYPAWDPDRPATLSPTIIREVIRGDIGFAGLLISDDIAMAALEGDLATRAAAALEAGCDLALHCSGRLNDMQAIAAALPDVDVNGHDRLERAMGWATVSEQASYAELAAKRDALLAYA